MKKMLTMVMVGIMMCSLIPYAFAIEDVSDEPNEGDYIFEPEPNLTHEEIVAMLESDPSTIVSNEYDAILQEKARAEKLLASGKASPIEIAAAKMTVNYDPAEKIYQLQEKPDKELKEMGLSEKQIQIVRNFEGTDAELRAIAANCSVSGNPKYTKNASGQWAKITFAFSWDKEPVWQMRDALVAQASPGFLPDTKVADIKCNINYKSPTNEVSYEYFTGNDLKLKSFSSGCPAGFSFNVMENRHVGLIDCRCFAQSGMATIVFRSIDTHQVQLSYGYAQATMAVSPSIGISFSDKKPSVGLNFMLSSGYTMYPKNEGGVACAPHFFT